MEKTKMRRIIVFLFFLCFCTQVQALGLISDEETESYLFDLLTPVFKEAHLPLNRTHIHIVKDDSLNAFVGDQNHMFVHTGTLLKAEDSNEIEGVLAHETGHILGGHILRLKIKMQDMQMATLASLVAAGTAAAVSGRGDAAIAVVLGAQSSAINSMASYQVTEERAADETAVLLLKKNHKSIRGLKNFMTKIQEANRLQGIEENAYFKTHPMTTERVTFFEDKLKEEQGGFTNAQMNERLKRIQAKLFAYLSPLDKVLSRYPLSDTSVYGKIAHCVYYMRQRNLNAALKYANELINAEPQNPYFSEMKAQAYFESGKIKEAVGAYRQTLNLRPQSDLFKLSYAEAILASQPTRNELKDLIPMLEHVNRHPYLPVAYLYLGQIYANMGDENTADYFAAEYNHATGKTALAKKQIDKVLKKNLRPEIKLRAEDLKEKLQHDVQKKSLF